MKVQIREGFIRLTVFIRNAETKEIHFIQILQRSLDAKAILKAILLSKLDKYLFV